MTGLEFIGRMRIAYRTHQRSDGSQRRGQYYFNLLYQWHPILANVVRSSAYDPFHNDARIPSFTEFVINNWSNYDR